MKYATRKWSWTVSLSAVLALSGCETLKKDAGEIYDPVQDTFTEVLGPKDEQENKTPSPRVMEALIPEITVQKRRRTQGEPRFDVSVNVAPAREFFMSLVEGTSHNMIVHPAVEGEVSLDLKNVTVRDVLDAVKDTYGYQYEVSKYGFRIMPRGLRTEMFQVDYVSVSRSGNSNTTVIAGGQVSAAGSTSTDDKSTSGTAEASGSGSSISTNSEWNFWREIESVLEVIVGNEEGRSVITNPNTGVIIVRAMPDELLNVRRLLDAVSSNLHRQVIIEAKILEVTLNDDFQTGINWTLLGVPGVGKTIIYDQSGGGSALGTKTQSGTFLGTDSVPTFPPTFTTFGGIFSMLINANDFQALIELLEGQGNVQTLSSPRVSTLNNQKAVIKVGSDEYFVTGVSTESTSSGGATTTSPTVELTPFFSGIALDVTPQISDGEGIILHIHPSISNVTEVIKSINVGTIGDVPLATSTIRESDSVVKTQSGQVVVIGGLMENSSTENYSSTPFLSAIPYLGSAFRHLLNLYEKTELVILLKGTVVGEKSWEEILNDAADRFLELETGRRPEYELNLQPGGAPAP